MPPHEPFFFFSRFRIMFTVYTESILVFLRKARWEFQVKFCFLKGTSWISSPTTYRLSPFQYPPISLCFSLSISLHLFLSPLFLPHPYSNYRESFGAQRVSRGNHLFTLPKHRRNFIGKRRAQGWTRNCVKMRN